MPAALNGFAGYIRTIGPKHIKNVIQGWRSWLFLESLQKLKSRYAVFIHRHNLASKTVERSSIRYRFADRLNYASRGKPFLDQR